MDRPEQSAAEQPDDVSAPSDEAVRGQLARVLGSNDFAQAERTKSFLSYVVEETLAGRGDRLKEYAIATEVFDRDESFDPQTNTIVRVEAGRLRRRLERYYLTAGRDDEVRIDLPKGTYVPLFRTLRPTPRPQPQASEVSATSAPSDAAVEIPTGPSIAVLPFANLSGDPGQDFFADGVAEEIINNLTRFPDLRVISRHTTFKYKGQSLDIRDVGRDLGVRYVLEGSVRKGGDMVRVTGQLVDASDGSHLFSETFDRDLSTQNILEIQDDIATGIVSAVGQPYGVMARAGARLARSKPTEHLDAYDAVLQFYDYWVNSSSEGHEKVRTALERAVELDPDYASAWATLAEVYLHELIFGFNPRPDGSPIDRALEAVQRAVRLDPESSIGYHVLSNTHFHRGELDEFKAAGERAIALNPNHADMLADYGIRLCCIGQWDRGMALVEKAITLSPTHPGWFHCARFLNHYWQGEYEAALSEAQQVQMPAFYWNFVFTAMCYGQLGREEEGRKACEKVLELAPDFGEYGRLYLAAWNMPPELIEQVADGLRKAGLSLADPPT